VLFITIHLVSKIVVTLSSFPFLIQPGMQVVGANEISATAAREAARSSWVVQSLKALSVVAGVVLDGNFSLISLRGTAPQHHPQGLLKVGDDVLLLILSFMRSKWEVSVEWKAHQKAVWGCSFSPDGESFLTASGDRTVKVWSAHTGELKQIFKGHGSSVVACSYMGRMVLSGSWAADQQQLMVWEAASGTTQKTLVGHVLSLNCCCASHDGKRVLSGDVGGILKIWDVDTAENLCTIQAVAPNSGDCPEDCCFSHDNLIFLVAFLKSSLKLWNGQTFELLRTFDERSTTIAPECITSCHFAPDGGAILSGSGDSTLKVHSKNRRRSLKFASRVFLIHTLYASLTFIFDQPPDLGH
jgi:WD40 repeat protein